MDYVGECRRDPTDYVSYLRNLPVSVFAKNTNRITAGGTSNAELGCTVIKHEYATPRQRSLEIFRAIDELGKLGYFKVSNLNQVRYIELVESRGVDSCHEVFQILAKAGEGKVSESGKYSPYCGRRMHSMRANSSTSEFDL